ncbi:hypothetical protein BJX70DRAFT_377295 [Aspergillus crustosus]
MWYLEDPWRVVYLAAFLLPFVLFLLGSFWYQASLLKPHPALLLHPTSLAAQPRPPHWVSQLECAQV